MVLTEIKEKKLVKCLNEETKKGRLYELTELGKNAIAKYG
jgi:DNA-binding PadR family transcriptional regulator